jgi:hypothetical protein
MQNAYLAFAVDQDLVDDSVADPTLLKRQKRLRKVVAAVLAAAVALLSAAVVLGSRPRSPIEARAESSPTARSDEMVSTPVFVHGPENDEEGFGIRADRLPRSAQRTHRPR